MQEEWRDISGFEGRYQVSNTGRVKSLSRKVNNHTGMLLVKEKILTAKPNPKGYVHIRVNNNDGVKSTIRVHRAVAEAFLSNPDNKPQVNHIDGNKSNNIITNLEWCTNGENQIHAYKNGLNHHSEKSGRPKKSVIQIDAKTGRVVCEYDSIAEAAKAVKCKTSSLIGACCRKEYGRKTIMGYRWEFKE